MATAVRVKAGYEIGSGALAEFEEHHVTVTGQTAKAGKTTAIEALAHDWPNVAALVFLTKRGEKVFSKDVKKIQPYLRERSDWRYVESLIEGALQEKNRIIRTTIMRVCQGTSTLEDVWRNVQTRLNNSRLRPGFERDMLTQLDEYLKIIVPQVREQNFNKKMPPMRKGEIYAMDLSGLTTELQGMVIGSVAEYISKHEEGTLFIVPEAWEFLPNGRGTPAKLQVEALIRKGAVNRNFVVIDSQDIAGIHPPIRKQVGVWLLGRQGDRLEAKRTLDNIPQPPSKLPKRHQIQTLEKGEFYLVADNNVRRIYTQPLWMQAKTAIARAKTGNPVTAEIEEVAAATLDDEKEKVMIKQEEEENEQEEKEERIVEPEKAVEPEKEEEIEEEEVVDDEEVEALIEAQPHVQTVEVPEKVAEVIVTEKVIPASFDDSTPEGMICILIHEGYFERYGRSLRDIHAEISKKFDLGSSYSVGANQAATWQKKRLLPALVKLSRKPYEVLSEDGAVFLKGKRSVLHREKIMATRV